MKTTKLVYWASTIFFSSLFTVTGTLYLLHNHTMVEKSLELGYPLYLLDILGTAKLLGAVALLTPKFPRIKEWAYAGFAFDFIGAAWSHTAVQGLNKGLPLLVPSTVLAISYIKYHKLQSKPQLIQIKQKICK